MTDQMPDEVWLDWHWELPDVVAHVFDRIDGSTRYIRADLYEQAEAERDAIRQQAEIWAQEARTQRATVHECYQACTGATGEPGDWHGAEPVRAVVAERDRLREAVSEAKRRIGIYMDDECSYDETLEMGRFVLDAFHGLQEALDHD